MHAHAYYTDFKCINLVLEVQVKKKEKFKKKGKNKKLTS